MGCPMLGFKGRQHVELIPPPFFRLYLPLKALQLGGEAVGCRCLSPYVGPQLTIVDYMSPFLEMSRDLELADAKRGARLGGVEKFSNTVKMAFVFVGGGLA